MLRKKDPYEFLAVVRVKGSNQSREGIDGTKVQKRLELKIEKAYLRKVEL
jgi:hypothetical protein